jgi:hypothetical protein
MLAVIIGFMMFAVGLRHLTRRQFRQPTVPIGDIFQVIGGVALLIEGFTATGSFAIVGSVIIIVGAVAALLGHSNER